MIELTFFPKLTYYDTNDLLASNNNVNTRRENTKIK